MKNANAVFANVGTTVFEVMSRLAQQHDAVNLGQGFPDGNGPDDVRAFAERALGDRPNQYPPMMGVPELRQAVAQHAHRFYGLAVDWQNEVLVTSGATEALAAAIFALIEPGDEVVLFEPLYDSYLPILRRAGAVPRLVRLAPPNWEIPESDLRAAFSPRTKAILLNTPLNPAGKVFRRSELALIASLVEAVDGVAICDEVYEHIVFDGATHVPLMTLPGMRERCLRIGSAGKTFSLTGWKVGYITAAPALLAPVAKAHQFLTFTTPPNLQRAVAYGLAKDDRYYRELSGGMQRSRDRLRQGLERVGFRVAPCDGTYFLNADFRPLGFDGTDEDFCRHLVAEAGVAAIPVSAFYDHDGPSHFVRFCFCKRDQVIDHALARLEKFVSRGPSRSP
ncbi:MAG: aminotransferase [Alphaproteobacteria bacterium]|nr:aminotransferase [Alphaproteobacteria bacterium]